MVVVVGGVLVLRLHAFLALTLGALVVGGLTTQQNIEDYARIDAQNDAQKKRLTGSARELHIEQRTQSVSEALSKQATFSRVADGFGKTCTSIGILIALASIIGKCVLDSGAADRIVRSSLRVLGEKRAPLAFLGSGFLLGIPVFFDTVFYLTLPLGKAMAMRTGRNYLLYIMAIGAGATMTHSLVPPTPGPLTAAEFLGVPLGTMILVGLAVGSITATSGYAYALWANSRWEVPLRDSPDISLEKLKALTQQDESELPPLWLSLLPILLPVLLIGGVEVGKGLGWKVGDDFSGQMAGIVYTMGEKNMALLVSAGISMLTLVFWKHTSRKELAVALEGAITGAGSIILITAAGGAFGTTLMQTGIGAGLENLQGESLWMIVAAWGLTALIRTAQGSATVAMITAAGVFAGVAASGTLTFNPVYLAVAIGCGSKPIAWMNDSGFWVVCKMSGMTETEALKLWTPMTTLMGVVGLGVTLLGAWMFPLL